MSGDRLMALKPIETFYSGRRFRSRLEARWAVFMDCLDLGFRYEPEGYELPGGLRYLPDFFVPAWDAFLEIKSELPTPAETRKAVTLAVASAKRVFLLFGEPREGAYDAWIWTPEARWSSGFRWSGCDLCGVALRARGLCPCDLMDGGSASLLDWRAPASPSSWIRRALDRAAAMRFEFRHDRD